MDGTVVDSIAPQLKEIMEGVEGGVRIAAAGMLGLVFAFQLFWAIGESLLRGGKISDVVPTVVKELIVAGVFTGLIVGGDRLADQLIEWFERAGSAGGTVMTPSAILGTGAELTNNIVKAASLWNGMILYLVAAVIMLMFAIIAGIVIVKYCEAAFVISGGLLLLGFGGSRWTRDQAWAAIRYVFSVGAALFILRLLTGVGSELSNQWVEAFNANAATMTYADCVVAMAGAVVLAMLVYQLPATVQALTAGTSVHGMSSLMASASFLSGAGALAASKAYSAVGVGGTAATAYKLSAATREGAGQATTGIAGRAGTTVAALGHAAKGMALTMHDRAAGRISPHGLPFWQTSATMGDKARQQRADNQAPKP